MRYLISEKIIFNPVSGILQKNEADDVISLPEPATLILAVLVENPGTVLSRNTIMEAAWEPHGLTMSGNNLNNYLSVIRHSFQNLGIREEIIKTLPRVGLLMTAEIHRLDMPNELFR